MSPLNKMYFFVIIDNLNSSGSRNNQKWMLASNMQKLFLVPRLRLPAFIIK